MKQHYDHMVPGSDPESGQERFFRHAGPPYGRTKEQAWEELQGRLGERPPARVVRFGTSRVLALAAAVAVLLLGTFLVMRYYSVSISSGPGQLMGCSLPDGSRVELNAASGLSYHPYWWRFSRVVEFQGEGYFEVEKGKEFAVISDNGTTRVLGTSFTVFSRDEEYRVACLTGKVRVESPQGSQTVLIPGHTAEVAEDGSISVGVMEDAKNAASWITGMFSFRSRPLRLVLDEIQRQYGIAIRFEDNEGYRFTGYFSKDKPVEEVLALVCKPFGLNFVKHSDTSFEVMKK